MPVTAEESFAAFSQGEGRVYWQYSNAAYLPAADVFTEKPEWLLLTVTESPRKHPLGLRTEFTSINV